jgi:hypothetical protein
VEGERIVPEERVGGAEEERIWKEKVEEEEERVEEAEEERILEERVPAKRVEEEEEKVEEEKEGEKVGPRSDG